MNIPTVIASINKIYTIVIACLGLFGLATFSAQQRMREIGIRKVLRASVASIGALLSRDFLKPVQPNVREHVQNAARMCISRSRHVHNAVLNAWTRKAAKIWKPGIG